MHTIHIYKDVKYIAFRHLSKLIVGHWLYYVDYMPDYKLNSTNNKYYKDHALLQCTRVDPNHGLPQGKDRLSTGVCAYFTEY